jgi:hypothetical protein
MTRNVNRLIGAQADEAPSQTARGRTACLCIQQRGDVGVLILGVFPLCHSSRFTQLKVGLTPFYPVAEPAERDCGTKISQIIEK